MKTAMVGVTTAGAVTMTFECMCRCYQSIPGQVHNIIKYIYIVDLGATGMVLDLDLRS